MPEQQVSYDLLLDLANGSTFQEPADETNGVTNMVASCDSPYFQKTALVSASIYPIL
jgi:hypothetical protein